MPRDSAAADRPASYLVGTAAAFPLFFRDRTKPINQLPFSPSAKFPKSGSSCESRANRKSRAGLAPRLASPSAAPDSKGCSKKKAQSRRAFCIRREREGNQRRRPEGITEIRPGSGFQRQPV